MVQNYCIFKSRSILVTNPDWACHRRHWLEGGWVELFELLKSFHNPRCLPKGEFEVELILNLERKKKIMNFAKYKMVKKW